jgi:drug/metabolite transporter (DMT)-like permease
MLFWLALLSALGGALCVGVAAVLEKSSADKEEQATSLRVGLMWKLLADWPYLLGLALDCSSFFLTLVAVHTLALFVVEPIIAFNVIITALIEYFWLHRKLGKLAWSAIVCTLVGLTFIALAASPESAHHVSRFWRWLIILMPLAIAAVGSVLAKSRQQSATVALGVMGGLAFGATAIEGRMIVFPHIFWQVIYNPLIWSVLAYSLIGMMLFTIALQRNNASIVGASTTASETVIPVITGIVLLGDSPKPGTWSLVIIGLVLTIIGTLIIASSKAAPTVVKIS